MFISQLDSTHVIFTSMSCYHFSFKIIVLMRYDKSLLKLSTGDMISKPLRPYTLRELNLVFNC